MGDRTFSAEDVIRIYELFLTKSEQETVDFFFRVEPMETPSGPSFEDLEKIGGLLQQARVPIPGLFGLVLRFLPFAATLVGTIDFATRQANTLVNQLLNLEGTSA